MAYIFIKNILLLVQTASYRRLSTFFTPGIDTVLWFDIFGVAKLSSQMDIY